jgi:hypothetical protein
MLYNHFVVFPSCGGVSGLPDGVVFVAFAALFRILNVNLDTRFREYDKLKTKTKK